MTEIRPKLGVLLLSSAWMRDVGLQVEGSALSAGVMAAGREILEGLAETCDLAAPPVACSAAEAARAGEQVAAAACDALLVAPLVWCEDEVLREALRHVPGLPLILATFVPRPALPREMSFEDMLAGSGVVGTLQASGMLAREGRAVTSVCGWHRDPSVYRRIGEHARACAAVRRLRGSRIGVLPFRCSAMSVTWVDELQMRSRHGVELVPIELGAAAAAAEAVSAESLAAYRAELDRRGIEVRVDARNLAQGARYAVALDILAEQRGLDGFAVNDIAPELHARFGLRPCLPSFGLCGRGVPVAMEADVAACAAMMLLGWATGEVPFYSEIFSVDLDERCLLMGHAGVHDPANRNPGTAAAVVPDEEYRAVDPFTGAAIWFTYRPGPVTAVNSVFADGRLRWSVLEGESLPGPVRMPGNAHLVCRLDEPVQGFVDRAVERGVSQHWIVVPGHHAGLVAALCRWGGIAHGA